MLDFKGFMKIPTLTDGTISLKCTAKHPADPQKGWVPSYDFDIYLDNSHILGIPDEKVGDCRLRIGTHAQLRYPGHIGYAIDAGHRGNGYAAKACRLLRPVALYHGLNELIISVYEDNSPSWRVCEKLCARFVKTTEIPQWHDLYAEGAQYMHIFNWNIEKHSKPIMPEDKLYKGKARDIYSTNLDDIIILKNRDDLTSGNGAKRGSFEGKGAINNCISSAIFRYLMQKGINTHYIGQYTINSITAVSLDMLPLEVVVRNVAYGSFASGYGIKEGKVLNEPLIEYFYKNDKYNDPMLAHAHIMAMELATPEQIEIIDNLAKKINYLLIDVFDSLGIMLIDFKMEFGIDSNGFILLADEISPDTCRLWDKATKKPMDKDIFRKNMGGIKEAYQEVLRRMEDGGYIY